MSATAFFGILGDFEECDGTRLWRSSPLADKGPFWTNRVDPDAFDRILDYLLSVSQSDRERELAAQNFQRLIIHDPGNTRLRDVLSREVERGRQPSVLT